MGDPFNVVDAGWWLAWSPATPLFVTAVLWALAAVSASWLRYDAVIWSDAWEVIRGRITPWKFASNGMWCDLCSTYWLTVPLLVWFGPVPWLAVNGAYLLLAKHAPTLRDVQVEVSPVAVTGEAATAPTGGWQQTRPGVPPPPDGALFDPPATGEHNGEV